MKEGFIQIKPEYFLKGMYVDSDVFYIQNERPVLFCKQAIISDEKLLKLKDIAESDAPIFVSLLSYKHLMEQYKRMSRHGQKSKEQFNNIKTEFTDLYDDIRKSGKIKLEDTHKLVKMVSEAVDEVELSFLVRWVSYLRDSDEYLYTHCMNVGILNGMMGRWLGFSSEEEEKLVLIGLLHDVGKTKIDDAVLNKPGKLTAEEFQIIKKHPVYSYEMLEASGITDEVILKGVRGHHEKGNGNGYPDGLQLNDISLYAKITSISDIYDAMVAKRVYKEAQTPFIVLDEFYKNKFSDLDIRLVDIFLNKMATEMVGKEVILSNGKLAKIVFVEKTHFAYPVVLCEDEVITTSKDLRCEALSAGGC